MKPTWGVVAAASTLSAVLAAFGAWTAQGWRGTASTQMQVAVATIEHAAAATAARTAEADQRQIEFKRMEANAQVTYNDQARRAAIDQAARNNAAALVGLRNALAAAEARALTGGGQASSDPDARTGADDPRTLRIVASECTAEYGEMAANAIGAGITLTGLQDYAQTVLRGR